MKKSLFALMLMWSNFIGAQDFSLSPIPTLVEGVAAYQPLVAYADITNHTDTSQLVIWERLSEDIPAAWTSNVCTPLGCFLPEVPKGELPMIPFESLNIDVQFETNEVAGSGHVEVKIYFDTDSSDYVVGIYEANAISVDVENVEVRAIPTLYPNPSKNSCYVFNDQEVVGYEIYSPLGVLYAKDRYNTTGVPLSTLENGMYYVRLFDQKGELLTTASLSVLK